MTALRSTAIFDTAAPAPRAELKGCDLCAAFATASAAPRSPFAPGEQLFRQGEPVRLVYRVLKGAVISYRLLSDGRRQVTAFHLPGDFVGLEAGTEHTTTAEALSTVHASAIERSELAGRAEEDNNLARALWQITVRAVHRSEHHGLVIAGLVVLDSAQ